MRVDEGDSSAAATRAPMRAFSYHAMGGDAVAGGGILQKPANRPLRSRSVSDIRASVSDSSRAAAAFPPTNTSDQSVGLAPALRHTFTLGQIPSFVRELSSLVAPSVDDSTIRCHICFDDVAQDEATKLSSCGHSFCALCLKQYLELKIVEGNVYPICFHPVGSPNGTVEQMRACGVALDTAQVENIVDDEHWTKFCRFRFNNEHEHARDCPYCLHSAEYPGPTSPECRCENCFKTFCFFHGNAHELSTCADYELKNAETEALNKLAIQEIAKPCPGCQRNVEKDGGCNHMKCIACHTSFCWLCGELIEDTLTPSHFDASNGGKCSGRQFDGLQSDNQLWWLRIYIVFATIVCAPPALLLGLLITPLIWCLRPHHTFGEIFESTVTNLTIVFQAPLAVAFFAVVLCLQGIARLFALLVQLIWCGPHCTGGRGARTITERDTIQV